MSKRATTKDIAALAGVSRTTVSFVLNGLTNMRISEETRQRVLEAARKLDYHPDTHAIRMVSGRAKTIGFIVRQSQQQVYTDHFLPQLLSGLSHAASEQGYDVLFEAVPADNRKDIYKRLFRERHVDGIVLSSPIFDDRDLLQMHADGAPFVLIGYMPTLKVPSIDIDNTSGAAQATKHLIELGHRRIAIITNGPPNYASSAARLTGYRQALTTAGIGFNKVLVCYGDLTPKSGDDAMTYLLTEVPRPSAVFIASDTVAFGAIQAVRRCGLRIPEDIAVVSFDDVSLAQYVDPPLTTVQVPAYDIGYGAAQMLICLLEDGSLAEKRITLETQLVVRASSGDQVKLL